MMIWSQVFSYCTRKINSDISPIPQAMKTLRVKRNLPIAVPGVHTHMCACVGVCVCVCVFVWVFKKMRSLMATENVS